MPNWAIEMGKEIGTDGLVLLLALRYHSGENKMIFPAYTLLEEHTGLNRHRIAKAIRKLEELKIIERQKRFGQSTIYRLKNLLSPTSSADSALMEEPPVVPNVHSSSADSAPSVVPNVHTNKTHLTRPIEQEEDKPATPTTNFKNWQQEIMPLITRVTGLSYFPSSQMDKQEAIFRLLEDYGLEQTEQAFKKHYQKWVSTPRKNGGTYNPLNFGWIDWAQAEFIGVTVEKPYEQMNQEEKMAWISKQASK